MKSKPTGGNISFQDLYESMDHLAEKGKKVSDRKGKTVAGMSDDGVEKLYNQMKDEQLSGAAAMQFKDIVREMKKRKISMNEAKTGGMEELGLLIEGATENALKSLQAILGMFKGKHDNDIYKMGSGIMDYYKKEKSFSPDQAKWIWKTSVALFK